MNELQSSWTLTVLARAAHTHVHPIEWNDAEREKKIHHHESHSVFCVNEEEKNVHEKEIEKK